MSQGRIEMMTCLEMQLSGRSLGQCMKMAYPYCFVNSILSSPSPGR